MAKLIMTVDSDDEIDKKASQAQGVIQMETMKDFFEVNDSDSEKAAQQNQKQDWNFKEQIKLDKQPQATEFTLQDRIKKALRQSEIDQSDILEQFKLSKPSGDEQVT